MAKSKSEVVVYDGKLPKSTVEAVKTSEEAEKTFRQTLKFNIVQTEAKPLKAYGIQPTAKNPSILGFFYKTEDNQEGWQYLTDLIKAGVCKADGEYTGVPVIINKGVFAKA